MRTDENRIPASYKCSITCEIMTDPVVCADGHTYERTAIEKWLKKNNTSPITRQKLASRNFLPNYALKSAIAEWRDMQKSSAKSEEKITSSETTQMTTAPIPIDYPIHRVIKSGNREALRAFFCGSGDSSDSDEWKLTDKNGRTPLELAAFLGEWDMVKAIITFFEWWRVYHRHAFAKKNPQDYGLNQAFFEAARANKRSIMNELKRAGAETNFRGSDGNYAIHHAMLNDQRDFSLFDATDLTLKNKDGRTAFFLGAHQQKWNSVVALANTFKLNSKQASTSGANKTLAIAAAVDRTHAISALKKAGAVSTTCAVKLLPATIGEMRRRYENYAGFFNASSDVFKGVTDPQIALKRMQERAKRNKGGASEKTLKAMEERGLKLAV